MNSGIHTDRLNFPKEENESRFRMINFLLDIYISGSNFLTLLQIE